MSTRDDAGKRFILSTAADNIIEDVDTHRIPTGISRNQSSQWHMPLISQFLGVSVYLYVVDGAGYHVPHIHAHYAEYAAAFSIESGEVLAGKFPRRKAATVKGWILLRRAELMDNWERACIGAPTQRVKPI